MNLSELCESLSLKVINGDVDSVQWDGVYVGDLLSRAMSHVHESNLWITIMSNSNVIAVASLTEAAAVILAEGVELLPDAMKAAVDNEVVILSTTDSVYDLCQKIGETVKRA